MTRAEFAAAIREKYMLNQDIAEIDRIETYDALFHTGSKLIEYFNSHDEILISVSGGSDSDCIVHLICTYFQEFLEKCHFCFVNTGLEYSATKSHLDDLEKRYNIKIDRIRGKSVVYVVKRYGVPILSKMKSEMIRKYVAGQKWAERYIFTDVVKSYKAMQFNENQRSLARYIKENGIKISAKCCDYSKKKPLTKYSKEHNIDLNVTGERKAEGGQRALAHKSCFESSKRRIDKYMPLWWWSDSVKRIFKQTEDIRYSDCYEVYGMRRTGCVGCPFNIRIGDDLKIMQISEPRLYKACMNVFGEAYRLTDEFHARARKCIPDDVQESLFIIEE